MNTAPISLRLSDPDGLGNLVSCRRCDLAGGRLKVVPGFGPVPCSIMIVAQSPGNDEENAPVPKPFVGRSGQYLNHLLGRLGCNLDRDVFRTNVNKCHPYGNKKCSPAQVRACAPWLEMEIELVDPDVIICVGDSAYKALMPEETSSITQIRGNVYKRHLLGRDRFVIPTVHPSFVMRNTIAYEPWLMADLRKALQVARDGHYTPPSAGFRKHAATWDEVLEAVKAPRWGFDLETDTGNGDDVYENDQGMRGARIIGLGVCAEPGNGLYYPFADDDEAYELTRQLKPYLESRDHQKIVSNAKFELHVTSNYGITIHPDSWEDTMLLAWLAGDYPLSLKDGFHRATGIEMIRIKSFFDRGFKRKDMRKGRSGTYVVDLRAAQDFDPDSVVEYAAQDADASLRLYDHLIPILTERGLIDLYQMEREATYVVLEMEREGFLFRPELLADAERNLRDGYVSTIAALKDILGWELNPNSPIQVRKALYQEPTPYRLQPFPITRTNDNQYPTDKTSLGEYSANTLVSGVLTGRAVKKMIGTYIEALPRWMDAQGRIHAEFKQTGAETGRISSNNPNITNIPSRKRDDIPLEIDGALIRRAFVAPEGRKICAPDLSQIEARVAAHCSGDEAMIEEMQPGGDIHGRTVTTVFGITKADTDPRTWKNYRDKAKIANFGAFYGLREHGLLKRVPNSGMTLADAKAFIDGVYLAFPKFGQWQRDVIAFTRANGYAETIMGRRRYFPEITSSDFDRRGEAERGAINHPIQGSAADYFRRALINVQRFLREHPERDVKMIAQVHDELVLEVADADVAWCAEHIPPIMATAIPLRVPVFVDFDWGQSWGELHAYELGCDKCRALDPDHKH